MTISAISDLLTALAPVGPAPAVTPTAAAQEQFSAMLARPATTGSPDGLIDAQAAFNQLTVGTELTAKVAGSLTQSVNKLVNMQ